MKKICILFCLFAINYIFSEETRYDVFTVGMSISQVDGFGFECSYIDNFAKTSFLPPFGCIFNVYQNNIMLSFGIYTGFYSLRPNPVSKSRLMFLIPNFEIGGVYNFQKELLGIHTGIWINLFAQLFLHYDIFYDKSSQLQVGVDFKIPITGNFTKV